MKGIEVWCFELVAATAIDVQNGQRVIAQGACPKRAVLDGESRADGAEGLGWRDEGGLSARRNGVKPGRGGKQRVGGQGGGWVVVVASGVARERYEH